MSTHAFGDDQMRNYLTEALAGAGSPLTVMPQDPQDPWNVRFHDARFDSHLSIRQDRLVNLLDTRSPEAVAKGLEHRSAVSEIAMALTEFPDDWFTVDTHRGAEGAMYSGLLSVYLHSSDMEIDVPIDHIELDRPVLIAPRAMAAIEDQLDRITGTTADSRWTLITPVGDAISAGLLSPPSWSPGPAPNTESRSPAAGDQFTESYLSHRTDTASEASQTDFAAAPRMSNQSLRFGPEM